MYKAIVERLKTPAGEKAPETHIGCIIKKIRESQGKKSSDVAKSAGLDPRTFGAIECGRIKNPSLQNLSAIAKALETSPADFFSFSECAKKENIYHGSQKGEFTLEFTKEGFRVVSFTPILAEAFIGKILMSAGVRIEADVLPMKAQIFLQVIIGKLCVLVNQQEYFLKEGENFLLNGRFSHTFTNPLTKESTFLLVTVPSFLAG